MATSLFPSSHSFLAITKINLIRSLVYPMHLMLMDQEHPNFYSFFPDSSTIHITVEGLMVTGRQKLFLTPSLFLVSVLLLLRDDRVLILPILMSLRSEQISSTAITVFL